MSTFTQHLAASSEQTKFDGKRLLWRKIMPYITRESNPTLYQELFNARRAAVIEALILIHDLKKWLKEYIIAQSNKQITEVLTSDNIDQYMNKYRSPEDRSWSKYIIDWMNFYDNFKYNYENDLQAYILSDTKEMQEKINNYDRIQQNWFLVGGSHGDFIDDPNNSWRSSDRQITSTVSRQALRQALRQEYAIINRNELYAERAFVVISGLILILASALTVTFSPYFLLLMAIPMLVAVTNILAKYPLRRYLDTQGVPVVSEDEMLAISQSGREGIRKENAISLGDRDGFFYTKPSSSPCVPQIITKTPDLVTVHY